MAALFLATVVSGAQKEQAFFLKVSASLLIFVFVLKLIYSKFQPFISEISAFSSSKDLISIMLKACAVCLVTHFVSSFCKENASPSLAAAVDFSGRVLIVILALPLVENVIKTAVAFIN